METPTTPQHFKLNTKNFKHTDVFNMVKQCCVTPHWKKRKWSSGNNKSSTALRSSLISNRSSFCSNVFQPHPASYYSNVNKSLFINSFINMISAWIPLDSFPPAVDVKTTPPIISWNQGVIKLCFCLNKWPLMVKITYCAFKCQFTADLKTSA